MSKPGLVDRARAACERLEWSAASEAYRAAEAGGEALSGFDLERWAFATLWLGGSATAISTFERAEDAYRSEGNRERAAIIAIAIAQLGLGSGRHAEASAAIRRIPQLLAGLPDSEAHALVGWAMAYQAAERDATESLPLWERAVDTARRVGSATAEAASLSDFGRVLLRTGERERGRRLVEEAAAMALSGDVEPLAAGHVLCGTIWAFRDLGDWRSAAEWVDVTWRWVVRTKVSIYPGLCRFHRCEVIRIRGELDAAEREALAGCEELQRLYQPRAGFAYRELGEIRFRRGNLDGAARAFEAALGFGVDPEPGLARLRLARGEIEGAVRGLEEALSAKGARAIADRPFVLSVLVTAATAAGDVDRARRAAEQLRRIAEECRTDAHRAAAAQAAGEIALAAGDLEAGRELLRSAWELWGEVEAPFEAATARVLLARVAERQGDVSQARLDLAAARAAFERIGARGEVMRAQRLLAVLEGDRRDTRAFMFTDIVDSTRLQTIMGDEQWLTALSWHDRILRGVMDEYEGIVVKHQGDGFFAVFGDAGRALGCGCEIQRRLARHRAEHGFAPDVRIGVHAGEATVRDGDYLGEAVTLAARIAGAGSGGQVLCSAAALPEGQAAEMLVLKLKGIPDPVRVASIAI